MQAAEKISFDELEPISPTRPASRAAAAGHSAGERPAHVVVPADSSWQSTAILCLCALVLTAIGLAFFCLHRVTTMNTKVEAAMGKVELKLQELNAGISFDSKRQYLLLGIRDEIMRTNSKVSLAEAYEYAELMLRATEKYPSVDPLIFLSIGIVESGFDRSATSHADAKGLYQIWPSTGRMLARSLDWDYSDEILYDPAKNTELAALYLDILFSTYHDAHMVLAEYNGGPLNAGYLRADSDRTAVETRDYVRKVMKAYARLTKEFGGRGPEVRAADFHRDLNREGKKLGD